MASEPVRRTFRAPSAAVVMIASVAIALFLLGDAVIRAGIITGMLLAPWVLLALWFAYVFVYVSCVQTDASGIHVRNLLRIIDVPWGQIADLDMRWQLEIRLREGGQVKCFGGPSGGRPGRQPHGSGRPDQSSAPPQTSDLVTIREEWQTAVSEGPTPGSVRRSWDVQAVVILLILATWAVIAVLITSGSA